MDLTFLYFKLRSWWSKFLYNDVFLSLKIVFILANSVDSDEMQHYAAFHLGLQFAKIPGLKKVY